MSDVINGVPVELLERTICRLTHGHEHDKAVRELRAILAAATAQPAAQGEVQRLRDALTRLLSYAERQVCTHEETHRGGAIWEICDMCGAKWADDEGGKPDFEWPAEIEAARGLLAASTGQEV